jgi:hypothetical protein
MRIGMGDITAADLASGTPIASMQVPVSSCAWWCDWLPTSLQPTANCGACAGMTTTVTGAVDTSDLSNLPLALPGSNQATDADTYESMVAAGVSAPLVCPSGWTCTMLAGIPDDFVYVGAVLGGIAALFLLKGFAK